MKKKIVLLGSTGSIGKSFLNILKKDKKNCDILLLSVNRNINELLKQLKIFKVRNIVVIAKLTCLQIKIPDQNYLGLRALYCSKMSV